MDLARWWNTRGQLGRVGTAAIRRGFPRTHYFAQARSVFAVAAYRCQEIFDPPNSVTLWRLPETIEEEFEAGNTGSITQMNGIRFSKSWRAFKKTTSRSPFKHSTLLHRRIRNIFATSPLGRRTCCPLIRTVLRQRSGYRIARSRIHTRRARLTSSPLRAEG